MNEFSSFIQEQLDIRGWKPSELATRSGLSRQHISKLLNDKRDHLGQMPEQKTMEGLTRAFEGVSMETVRDVAARALGTVADDRRQTALDLQHVSIDALLTEIKRRVQENEDTSTQGTQGDPSAHGEARNSGTPMKRTDPAPETVVAMRRAPRNRRNDVPIGLPAQSGDWPEQEPKRESSSVHPERD
ncbi:helix-turn-helix domain-containing protein [Rhodococcus globerulus]|uniref:Helix-turn-helix transcriptional regulator n=1 Tax=Rhodococcus globerulus TaxID=33008 RepID=A0ABU4BS27_RHOGO|nr:helix-turn-helix transcriptional regulator [Rhodococcus globerulus]MDV6267027.1 helix-turn-helix transcriptional regulator [Rhodococcus globerulus]